MPSASESGLITPVTTLASPQAERAPADTKNKMSRKEGKEYELLKQMRWYGVDRPAKSKVNLSKKQYDRLHKEGFV